MQEEHRQYYLAWLRSDKQIPQYVIDNFNIEVETFLRKNNEKK
jgi:hypothetical protein